MKIYIPQKKITVTVKNRLHSRQQPCRSPRLTVIGIGLRELFYKSSLTIGQSGSAALPLPRVPPFLFYAMSLFCVYNFHAEALDCTVVVKE